MNILLLDRHVLGASLIRGLSPLFELKGHKIKYCDFLRNFSENLDNY